MIIQKIVSLKGSYGALTPIQIETLHKAREFTVMDDSSSNMILIAGEESDIKSFAKRNKCYRFDNLVDYSIPKPAIKRPLHKSRHTA
jgi:hypothetical protein